VKIAVISDIHSNLEALKTTLSFLQSQNISHIICLGDVIGYGPRPNECIELVKNHCKPCLMGNHDHAVLGLTDIYYFNRYAKEAVLWTQRELSVYNKGFLENLSFTYETDETLFVHSTPIDPEEWHYIFSEYEARQNLNQISHRLIFVGHSHIPIVFSYNNGSFLENHIQLDLEKDRYIVNVGSVGQPRDGDPRLCFVIYDDQEKSIEYIRLEYPVKKTYQEIIDQKLPPFLAMRLLAGQ
jgi:predicted phosphodiesterase